MRSYKLIKVKLELEEYLEVTAGKRKAALVETRSGANDLEIERGVEGGLKLRKESVLNVRAGWKMKCT